MPIAGRTDDFDHAAFFEAIDDRRRQEGLSWTALAAVVWDQSRVLNEQRGDHPISPATLAKFGTDGSCQHVLYGLRWLDRPPEGFLPDPQPGTAGIPLPRADEAHSLRWNLRRLYAVVETGRARHGATWAQTAKRLGCTPNQLTGLRTARYATGMTLAMRITQAARRPAADFIDVATW
jgi:hypothetical protein